MAGAKTHGGMFCQARTGSDRLRQAQTPQRRGRSINGRQHLLAICLRHRLTLSSSDRLPQPPRHPTDLLDRFVEAHLDAPWRWGCCSALAPMGGRGGQARPATERFRVAMPCWRALRGAEAGKPAGLAAGLAVGCGPGLSAMHHWPLLRPMSRRACVERQHARPVPLTMYRVLRPGQGTGDAYCILYSANALCATRLARYLRSTALNIQRSKPSAAVLCVT